MKRAPLWIGFTLLCACLGSLAHAQSLESIHKTYNDRYQARVDQALTQRQELFQKYLTVVEGLRQKAQDAGDLEGVLTLEKEILFARNAEKVTKEALKIEGIAPYRATLEREEAKIAAAEQADLRVIRSEFAEELKGLVIQLTKLGQTEQALQVRSMAQQVLSPSSAPPSPSSAVASNQPSPEAPAPSVPANDLMSRSPLLGEVTLPPGQYVISGRLVAGDRKNRVDAEVSTQAGTTITGGSILVGRGSWTAVKTLHVDTRLQSDLSWTVTATSSLFENCLIGKGGGWGSGGKFASKSTFEDCVFAKNFLERWQVTNTGIRAETCTFHDIVFPKVEHQDGVSEDSEEDWLTLKDCRFVDCVIPPEVLLITEDCYFERCTFPAPQVPLDIHSTLRVTLQLHDCGPVPDLGEKAQIKVVEGQITDTSKFGCPLRYKYFDKKLSF